MRHPNYPAPDPCVTSLVSYVEKYLKKASGDSYILLDYIENCPKYTDRSVIENEGIWADKSDISEHELKKRKVWKNNKLVTLDKTNIKFINGNKTIFFNDIQIQTFFKVIFGSIIILSIYLTYSNLDTFSFMAILFNIISILTGTGYVNAQFDNWGSFSLVLFLILMFIGGCAGSTTCGIKIFRIQILYSFIINSLKKIIYPKGIFVLKYDQNPIDNKFISSIISFIYMYLLIFFFITTLLSLTGLDFITSISGAATAISNVGPGLGSIIGPNGDFSSLPDVSKWILSVGMILGRLELFAILVLFLPSFWRKY